MPSYELWRHPTSRRWYVTWTVEGRSLRASLRTTDRSLAERRRAAFVLEQDKPRQAEAKDISLAEVLDSYYDGYAKKLPSADQARIAIDHMKGFYGDAMVSAVTPNNHDRYRKLCETEGATTATINRRRAVLRAALRRAAKRGDLVKAPFVPTEEEAEPDAEALTRDQFSQWLRAARRLGFHHTALFARVAVYSGARATAILQLDKRRIDPASGIVDFRLPRVRHKRKRRAVTALPAKLRPAIRQALQQSQSGRLIEYNGRPVKSLKRSIRLISAEAKLPWVSAHTFKHTAITWALRVASPWMVSGHTATSVRTLLRVYGKHIVDDHMAVAEAIAHSRTRNLRASPNPTESAKLLKGMVGATGIEPVTPTMSTTRPTQDIEK